MPLPLLKRLRVPGLLLLPVLAACASLPRPTPDDASRAGVPLSALADGRATYVGRCGSCHSLHVPAEFAPGQWPGLLDEMQEEQRVKLSTDERQRIQTFLVALSGRPR